MIDQTIPNWVNPASQCPGSPDPLIAGMMRISKLTPGEVRGLYTAAREAGVTTFDHAAIYGAEMHGSERHFANSLKLSSSERNEIVLQTKCGIYPGGFYDLSADKILESVHNSLRALNTDYLDVLLLHRPDPLLEVGEIAEVVAQLINAGKVQQLGVSNMTPGQISLLNQALGDNRLRYNQVQFSLVRANLVTQGMAALMPDQRQSIVHDGGGLLEFCQLHDVQLQAWSPLQSGFFTGTFLDNSDYEHLNQVLAEIAAAHGTTKTAIATAWITRLPAGIQVVSGTTKPERLVEMAHGARLGAAAELTREQWFDLLKAAGHLVP